MKVNSLSHLNICFIAGTLGQGGAERQLFYMLRCLKEHGAGLIVLCLTKDEHYEKKIVELNIPVVWVGKYQFRFFRFIKIFTELVKVRPDIFQSSHSYTNLYVTLISRLLGIKGIAALRNDFITEIFMEDRFLNMMGLRFSKIIVGNSKNALKNAFNNGFSDKNLYYLRNVIDTNYFKPINKDKKESTINLLSVGRLNTQKRYDRIIKILSELKKCGIQYNARIVGSGILKHELINHANIQGLLPGYLDFVESTPDILRYYQWADILLHTSEWEGTPNVVMEAMACGLPVVATNVGDIPFLIEHGKSGFFQDRDHIDGIVTSLIKLCDSRLLREEIGINARKKMIVSYSLSDLFKQQLELYSKVLK